MHSKRHTVADVAPFVAVVLQIVAPKELDGMKTCFTAKEKKGSNGENQPDADTLRCSQPRPAFPQLLKDSTILLWHSSIYSTA